jgi:hypothetical protein
MALRFTTEEVESTIIKYFNGKKPEKLYFDWLIKNVRESKFGNLIDNVIYFIEDYDSDMCEKWQYGS